jgi:hypothetical protein
VRLAHSLGYAHSFAPLCSYYILYFFISPCCIPSFELQVASTDNFTNYPSLACCLHSARPLARTKDAVHPFVRTDHHRAISRLLLWVLEETRLFIYALFQNGSTHLPNRGSTSPFDIPNHPRYTQFISLALDRSQNKVSHNHPVISDAYLARYLSPTIPGRILFGQPFLKQPFETTNSS